MAEQNDRTVALKKWTFPWGTAMLSTVKLPTTGIVPVTDALLGKTGGPWESIGHVVPRGDKDHWTDATPSYDSCSDAENAHAKFLEGLDFGKDTTPESVLAELERVLVE